MDSSASKLSRRWRIGRAELSRQVLIPGDEWHPLDGGLAPEYIPEQWDGVHVGARLIDAFRTLAQLPGDHRGGTSGYWPEYYYEWEDLLAQRGADQQTLDDDAKERNRARVRPSAQAISRMEVSLYWPGHYLHNPSVARIVQRIAFGRARDIETQHIAWRLRLDPKRMREANRLGLDIVAAGLRRDDVRVF